MPTTTARAVLYLRLSESDDASTSIARQQADLRARADREGWQVTAVLTDDGISGGKRRAKADEALAMLRDGLADVLLVWKFDRWSRQGLGAVADLTTVLDARPSALFVADRDGLSSAQPAWRIIAAVLSEVARTERENTSARVTSSVAALRRSGRFSGGNVPYGYAVAPNPTGPGRVLVPDPEEVTVVRGCAERVLAGTALYRVMLDLNAAAVPTRRGGTWSIQALGQVLTSDAILGRVIHRGEVIRDADGMPATVWEPVLDLETVHRLRAALTTAKPAGAVRRRKADARLLSGLASCGECGAPLYVRVSGKHVVTYSCSARSNGRVCPGLSVSAKRLEEFVVATFLNRHGDAEVMARLEATRDESELAEVERAIGETVAAMADDAADVAVLSARLVLLKAQRAEVRHRPASPARLVSSGRTYREEWESAEAAPRRELLAANVAVLAVRKGLRGRTGPLDPSRVTLVSQVPHAVEEQSPATYRPGLRVVS